MTFTRTPAIFFVTLIVALTAVALPVDFSGLESRAITDKAAINAAQIAIQLGQKAHKAANVEHHQGPAFPRPGLQPQGHAQAPAHDHKQNLPKPPPAPHAPHAPSIAQQVPKDAFKHPVTDAVRKAHGKRRLEEYELESRGVTDKAAINAAQIALQMAQKAHKAANVEHHKGPAFPRPGLQPQGHASAPAPAPGHKQSLPPPAPAAPHKPSIAEQIPKDAFKHPIMDAVHKLPHGKRMMEKYVSIDDLD